MDNFVKLIESDLACQNQKKLENNFDFIQSVLSLFFQKIKSSESYDDTILIFNTLEDVQFILAKAVFKNGITVTPELRRFVSDFDRIDDQDLRMHLYSQIKSGEYRLAI